VASDRINKRNTNLYNIDLDLFKALRKERFKKVKLSAYFNYMECIRGWEENPVDYIDFGLDLQKFLRGLSEIDRKVFTMCFLEDCTQNEIAEEVGLTQGRVAQLLGLLKYLWWEFYYEEDEDN